MGDASKVNVIIIITVIILHNTITADAVTARIVIHIAAVAMVIREP
jgi:hypothetical protein